MELGLHVVTVERGNGTGVTRNLEGSRSEAVGFDAGIQPEKRLMLAILKDAIDVVIGADVVATAHDYRLACETRQWFAVDDIDWPFSFVNICDALDLSVSQLRAWVAQRPVSPPPRVEPRRISDGMKLARSGCRQARALGWTF